MSCLLDYPDDKVIDWALSDNKLDLLLVSSGHPDKDMTHRQLSGHGETHQRGWPEDPAYFVIGLDSFGYREV
jgi:hypothetical protein